jgi:hypothetical protein
VAQRIGIIVVAPTLRRQQHAGAKERSEVMLTSTWLRGSAQRAVIQPTIPLRSTISRKSITPGSPVSRSVLL